MLGFPCWNDDIYIKNGVEAATDVLKLILLDTVKKEKKKMLGYSIKFSIFKILQSVFSILVITKSLI